MKKWIIIWALIIAIFFVLILALAFVQPFKEAEVYNKINGTDFSGWDFFWAGSQINEGTKTFELK